jgi:hypothetical protein
MKNIIKTIIVMFSSISLFASANAGELSVSGTAKATYNIESGKTNAGKGLGITNELNFTAAGELDNGYTWSYSMELDPNAVAVDNAGAQNDDTKLTLSTPYGTVGVFISEGGLDLEDAASQSVYGRPTDIVILQEHLITSQLIVTTTFNTTLQLTYCHLDCQVKLLTQQTLLIHLQVLQGTMLVL